MHITKGNVRDFSYHDGSNKADGSQIDWRQSSSQAVGHQGCSKERSCYRGRKEASSLSPWYCGVARNSTLPEVNWASHSEAAVPTTRTWNRSRFQDGLALPVVCCDGLARGFRSVLGWSFRRYQLVRYSCQARYHHAKGYSIGTSHSRRTRLKKEAIFLKDSYL